MRDAEPDRVDFGRYLAEIDRLRWQGGLHGPDDLVVLASTASTNKIARDVVADYESEGIDLHPFLVLAFEQSAGRGRQGRAWSSPRGRGVYATLVLPVADPDLLGELPLLVGVGLCRALAPHLPWPCRLKWPNDLVVEGGGPGWRKIGGVLIETMVRSGEPPVALVGFGVNHGHLPEDLPRGATSLSLERGEERPHASLAELTWDLVAGVERELTHLGQPGYAVAAYRAQSVHHPGERIVFHRDGDVVEGTFKGFDDHGLLRLERGGEELRLSAGEVIAEPGGERPEPEG
jgi:biotin-[acetyl-CoA-carboxylase] ligase BirA-like protein